VKVEIFLMYIEFFKRPDDGSQLQPKHAAVNKLIKTGGVSVTD
jgi:hypothetical protein